MGRYSIVILMGILVAYAAPARASVEEPASATATAVTLTEAEVVRQALERPSLRDALEGEVEIERGTAATLSAYPNPQLSYMREQTFGASGAGEDYISVAQMIDLGSRRRLRGTAAKRRARAVEHEGEAALARIAADARLRFYEVLYREQRVAALRSFVTKIESALGVVAQREARGDAALYDRRRLEREQSVADNRLETELGALDRARARLGALLDPPADVGLDFVVAGELLPATDPPSLPNMREAVLQRPDLRALGERREAAAFDRRAAGRWWVPDLRIEGGWKGVNMNRQGRQDGFLLGAVISLPLWNTAAGLSRSADGEARAATGRRALLEAELLAEITGLRAETVRLAAAARRARERATDMSHELVRIASAGYEGGELTVLELLDAYRGAADDELSVLDLDRAARHARIELDRAIGEVQ